MVGIALVPLAGSLRQRPAPAAIGGFAALLVPILFSLAALVVLVVASFADLHPVTVVLAALCLVAAGGRTALTFEQTRALARSRTEARTDELTTVGNRRMLDERLPALAAAAAAGRPLLVGIISIRHLSAINETLGYEYGDGMLAALGARLREQVGDRAVPARLGGAEIALLQPFDGHLARAEQSMRDLLAAVAGSGPGRRRRGRDRAVRRRRRRPDARYSEVRDLLRCAGEALRRAKATESEVEVYDPAQDIGRDFGPRLLPELIGALERNLIGAWYQPKVELAGGAAVELEAAAALGAPGARRPRRGRPATAGRPGRPDPPADPGDAGRGGPPVRLVAGRRYPARRRGRPRHRGRARQPPAVRAGPAGQRGRRASRSAIQLELAEDLLLVDPGRTRRALDQFRTLGVRLALDHYGRSAPSLTRLRTMPVQELKLDRSFVASVLQGGPDEAVVRSTISLARSLGIRTVADGVDTADLLDRVRSYGVRGVQGAAVGDPMSPDALADWLGTAPRPTRPATRPGARHSRSRSDDGRRGPTGSRGGTGRCGVPCCRRAPRAGSQDHPARPAGRRRARRRRAARLELDHDPPGWCRAAPAGVGRPAAPAGAGRWPAPRPHHRPTLAAAGSLVRAGEAARVGAALPAGRDRRHAAALAAALTVHALTGSLARAALAGSVAETVAYYGVILRRTVPRLYAAQAGTGPVRRLLRTGRSLLAEVSDFLAAELADTFLVRPGLIYLAAGWAGSGRPEPASRPAC